MDYLMKPLLGGAIGIYRMSPALALLEGNYVETRKAAAEAPTIAS